ncbi:hypothetical protein HYY75_10020, partial [bacterium]|nr:hypothetical protein [bacterium]
YPIYSENIRNYSQIRAFVEARKGERYSIRVRNNLSLSVGLVIAVDGRNIISGSKSYLRNNESMYLLRPGRVCTFEGWRSGEHFVNRFFFTENVESYAASWGDFSSIGVISIAVFPERRRVYEPRYLPFSQDKSERLDQAKERSPSSELKGNGRCIEPEFPKKDSHPGTGYGEENYSPTTRVEFEPEPYPIERFCIKYEWPENLNKLGVFQPPSTRVLPHDDERSGEFAPPPPPKKFFGKGY